MMSILKELDPKYCEMRKYYRELANNSLGANQAKQVAELLAANVPYSDYRVAEECFDSISVQPVLFTYDAPKRWLTDGSVLDRVTANDKMVIVEVIKHDEGECHNVLTYHVLAGACFDTPQDKNNFVAVCNDIIKKGGK